MRVSKAAIILSACLFILPLAATAVGQSDTGASENFLGSISGNVYKNPFFRFQISFPPGMYLLSEAEKTTMKSAGSKFVTRDMKGDKAALEKAVIAEVLLFSLADNEPALGTASLNVGALKQPAGVTPRMVCETARDFFVRNPMFTVEKDLESVKIGDRTMCTVELAFSVPGKNGFVRYFATILRGHSVTFAITYFEREQLEKFDKILRTLKFEVQ